MTWTRRRFLETSLSTLAPSTRRPNILFVFSDDHGYQAISAYGGGRLNRTPHIDRIAREGMLFRDCLVTNSICAPSRAVILTGKYSHRNGVLDNRQTFDGAQTTFPKLLQGAGYQTAIFGKWHLKSDPTGFDRWEVVPGQGNYYNPDFISPSGRRRREGYVTDIIGDLSLDWLKNGRDPARPFLLMCQHKAPHRNWMPGPQHLRDFENVKFPEPPTLFDDYHGRATPAHQQEMEIGRHMTLGADLKGEPENEADRQRFLGEYGRMTDSQRRAWDEVYAPLKAAFRANPPAGQDLVRWKYQRYLQDYLRCIASVDDCMGRLLAYLDESGLAQNTILVYSSDQGFYLGEHGWFDKRWMYEESLKTPLLVRWPGVARQGSECRRLVSNLDFAATFLDAAGVQPHPEMQGRSLVPLLRGRNPHDWRGSFYYQYYEQGEHNVARHCGVRTETHKLIHYYDSDEWELFDLRRDPLELASVYGETKYLSVQRELTAELARLRRELKVPEKDPDR